MRSERHIGFRWAVWPSDSTPGWWIAYVQRGDRGGHTWPGSATTAFGALRLAYTRCVTAEMARRLKA